MTELATDWLPIPSWGQCVNGPMKMWASMCPESIWSEEGPPAVRLCLLGTGGRRPALVVVLQPGRIVGIDMEWKPLFGAVGGKSRVSLVQMAVWGRVFLLDVLRLLEEERAALASFFQTLFADPSITKLGTYFFLPPRRVSG